MENLKKSIAETEEVLKDLDYRTFPYYVLMRSMVEKLKCFTFGKNSNLPVDNVLKGETYTEKRECMDALKQLKQGTEAYKTLFEDIHRKRQGYNDVTL